MWVCVLDRISRFSCIKYSSTLNFTNTKWWVRVCLCLWHCYSMAQIKVALPAGQISFHFFINLNCGEWVCRLHFHFVWVLLFFEGAHFLFHLCVSILHTGENFSQITFYTCSFEYLHWFYMRIVLTEEKSFFFVSVPLKTLLFVVDYKSLPPQFQRKFLYQQSLALARCIEYTLSTMCEHTVFNVITVIFYGIIQACWIFFLLFVLLWTADGDVHSFW